VKYWQIIADNLSKAGWSLGCVTSDWFQRTNHLDCWRLSKRRKAFRCSCGWKADCVYRARIGDPRGHSL